MAWVMPAMETGTKIAGTIMDVIGKQQQLGLEQQRVAEARRQGDMQAYLAMRGMNLQEQLSKAGQTDVYGNKVIYDPNTNSWVTLTSPEGQALINRSEAIQREQEIPNLTTGPGFRSLDVARRLAAGSGADALMTQLNRGYGAPTREGVAGANAV